MLQGAVSPLTCISFSDCRSFAPRPCCLAISISCQPLLGCFCSSVCFSFHLFVFAWLAFSLSTPSVPVFFFFFAPSFCLVTQFNAADYNKQFDCGCCGSGVVVVVMVDNTRSLGQHGNDAVSFGWSFIDILLKQIKLIYSLESSLWPTHHFLFILIAMGAMGNIANVWQEHVSGPGDRFQASTGPVPCSSCVWHTHVVTLSMSWEMNEQHFPKRRKVPLYTVHVIPTAVHTSGFPT